MYKKVYDFPPLHVNLTMSSLGAEEPQPTTKTHKTQNKHTYTQANTQILNRTLPNQQQDHT